MKWSLALALLVILAIPAVHGQPGDTPITNTVKVNRNNTTFPVITYSPDSRYEVDLTWEPHQILTDQKEMFIFQFYDKATGAVSPHIDYEFVVSQDGKELARIPGTTTGAGDYKYFAFDNPGPITISLDKINGDNSGVSYETSVEKNPNSSGHVEVVQPPRNISNSQRAIFPILEDVIIGGLIALLVWIAREHIFRKFKKEQ